MNIYFLNCTMKELDEYRDIIILLRSDGNLSLINMTEIDGVILIALNLTVEEYEIIKSYGFNIL